MKIKYIITEERNIAPNNEVRSLFRIDTEIEDLNPIEMPSMLLAERVEALQITLLNQFLKQNQKYQDAPKKLSELAQQGKSLHFQTPHLTNDTEEK